MFQGIKCVVHGADHIAKNKICQDAADFYIDKNYGAAVVADGHGGEKYVRSDVGSKLAVQSAIDTISSFMKDFEGFSKEISRHWQYIIERMQEQFLTRWSLAVEAYHKEHPLTRKEETILREDSVIEGDLYTMYGSTVLIAVIARDFYYGMLVGDGGFVVVEQDGSVDIPIEDERSYANYCSSICSKNAIDAFRSFYREGSPLSMSVSTDGLIKSFGNEEDFKEYHVLITSMLTNMDNCSQSLNKNLNKRTCDGSGDDISIALIFDEDVLEKQKAALEEYIQIKKQNRQRRHNQEQQNKKDKMKKQEKKRKNP